MPANKRRSRHGTNSTSVSSASPTASFSASHSILKSNSINFSNIGNGNPISTNNQINNNTHNSHHLKTLSAPATINGSGDVLTSFTLKQQQQLDRNAFLLTLTKDQLKVECRKRGQKTTGTKTDLVLCAIFFILIFRSVV